MGIWIQPQDYHQSEEKMESTFRAEKSAGEKRVTHCRVFKRTSGSETLGSAELPVVTLFLGQGAPPVSVSRGVK